MPYRGHVKDGAIRLDDPSELPEGAAVAVEVVKEAPVQAGRTGPMARLRQTLTLVNNRHGIPLFYAVLLLIFLVGNYFSALREDIIAECTQVLVIEGARTTDDLMARLSHLEPRKGPTGESRETNGAQAFNLIFPWPSALHLGIEFDPESGEIVDYGMYIRSDEIDLATHDGILPMLNGLAVVCALVAVLMTVLFYVAPRCGRLGRYSIQVLLVLTTLPLAFLALQVVGQCVIAWLDSDLAAAMPVQTAR